jgi:hypothetical protein
MGEMGGALLLILWRLIAKQAGLHRYLFSAGYAFLQEKIF